jgi:predicted carbohydrate-binding protein with CBM5 and CBM33 domain
VLLARSFNRSSGDPSQLPSFHKIRQGGILSIMFSKITSLLALVATANAHGYLSSPMSRTGLNAQVSVLSVDMSEYGH